MDYRRFGKSDLNVSVVSFGGSSLGGEFRPIDEDEGIRAVHVALDNGVNLIDVSPYYGRSKAETVLGRALKEIGRDRYHIATKCGRHDTDEFDFSPEGVKKSIDGSLRRLGLDHVDILFAHDIEFVDLELIVNETLPALREIQQAGKCRWIGVTGLPLKVYAYVVERFELDVILSYSHHSLNNTALLDLLPTLEAQDIGVISAAPVSMGLLTHRGPPEWHPANDEVKKRCRQAADFCAEKGVDISKLALQFSVVNERIHSTCIGTANPENMLKNIRWAEEPFDEELAKDVMKILAPIRNVTWPSGLPKNN